MLNLGSPGGSWTNNNSITAGAKVVLLGMRMPPNYGPAYVQRFDASFADIAKARKTALVPFLFEGFADDENMFQPDRIHPVQAAQAAWPVATK